MTREVCFDAISGNVLDQRSAVIRDRSRQTPSARRSPHLAWLLCACRERPGGRRAAEQRDKLAAVHSMTSSAWASSVGGTSIPQRFWSAHVGEAARAPGGGNAK
jgi:hypothetical protein